MDYKSPIEITMGKFRLEQEKRMEGVVFTAIQDYGITIDKDELIKALQYDRGQYDKGYEDGHAYAVREMEFMFTKHFGIYRSNDTIKVSEVFDLLHKLQRR